MANGIGPFGPPAPAFFRPSSGAGAVNAGPFRRSSGVGVTPPILGGQELFGPPEAPVAADKPGLTGVETAANVLAIAGLVTNAIGSFYQAESQKSQLKSQALTKDFEQSIANLNARTAEQDAVAIFAAGRRRLAQSGLQFGQVRGAARTSAAARGVQAGVGSAGEIRASIEFAAKVDALTIDANTFRATAAARRRAVDLRNQALFAGVSARNIRGSERSISPGLQAFTTLLGGAGPIASGIAQRGRFPPTVTGVPRTPGVTASGVTRARTAGVVRR